ncbi:calexcitin-2-like [Vanessa tameamea]|uniref:Calexcitin-2-like n=1 Tax=Vanessa tameamea TaxID=334116 RepID=A0A8B8HT18_VANTA|nr:calexcitin-2-like [Vanessa tameamea]
MVSEFRKKKLLYLFKIFFDADGSGTITKKDFDLTIERIAKAKEWAVGDEKYKQAEKAMLEIWQGMQFKADTNRDGEISSDEWVKLWEDYSNDPSSPVDWQTYYCKAIFHIQDSTGDGKIDRDEFVSVHGSFGLPKEDTNIAFDKLSNGKTSLSWEDFQERWKEFFTSDDPNAPGNFIFGNLSF